MEKTKSSTEKNEEYIQKLAPSLPKFEKVKNGVYKFRCVFCGDSKKNPNKRSGYFYLINNSQNNIEIPGCLKTRICWMHQIQ